MEFEGKVVQHLDLVTGQSARGEWKKQEFIVETPGDYPKNVCLSLWGDKVSLLPAVGSQVTCHVNLESREYNGRWYTEARAWKIDAAGSSPSAAPQGGSVASAPVQNATNKAMVEPNSDDAEDDLPF